MAYYRSKPFVIEAIEIRQDNWAEVCDFVQLPWGENGLSTVYHHEGVQIDGTTSAADRLALSIPTMEGKRIALKDDYIVKDKHNNYTVYGPRLFEMMYEQVPNE